MVEKLFPVSFLKNQNWAYLIISSVSFMLFVSVLRQAESYRNILELSCVPIVFPHIKLFYIQNEVWNSPCLIFCTIFEKKIFDVLYSITWTNFIVWLPLFCEILNNMCETLKNMCDGVTSTLVSRFACNTRLLVDASSSPPVSHLKFQ